MQTYDSKNEDENRRQKTWDDNKTRTFHKTNTKDMG